MKTPRFFKDHFAAFPDNVGHCNAIDSLVFSPDGNSLISSSHDGQVIVWDWQNETVLHRYFVGYDGDHHLQISPDGKLLSVTTDNDLKFISTRNGRCIHKLKGYMECVGFINAASCAISVSEPDQILIWDLKVMKPTLALDGSFTVIAGSRMLIAQDKTLELRDAATGELHKLIPLPEKHKSSWINPFLSPDGRWIFLCIPMENPILVDAESGEYTCLQFNERSWSIHPVFSPDSRFVVYGTDVDRDCNKAVILECGSWHPVNEIPISSEMVRSIAISNDGKLMAVASDDWHISICEMPKGIPIRKLKGMLRHVESIACVENECVDITYDDGNAYRWDCRNRLEMISRQKYSRNNMGFYPYLITENITIDSEDGECAVTYTNINPSEKCIVIYNVKTQETIAHYTLSNEECTRIWQIYFSLDAKILVIKYSNDEITIYDTTEQKIIRDLRFRGDTPGPIAISPDNTLVAIGSLYEGLIEIYNILTGKRMWRQIAHCGPTNDLSFYQGNEYLVSGGADGAVRLWSLHNRQPVVSFTRIKRDGDDEWIWTW